MLANACTFCGSDFALLAVTSASANPGEWRIGTFDSDSEPPATTQS
jgi:hypothetical protein